MSAASKPKLLERLLAEGEGIPAPEAAARLGERGFAVWWGSDYALEVMKQLGLEDDGGAVRVGFVHYNTADEVDRLLVELARLE